MTARDYRLKELTSNMPVIYRPVKPQNVRKFTSLTNETEKSDKVWKKCMFHFGICIGFGCSAGFQLFDWLSNESFQSRCYSFMVHAKTETSKSFHVKAIPVDKQDT